MLSCVYFVCSLEPSRPTFFFAGTAGFEATLYAPLFYQLDQCRSVVELSSFLSTIQSLRRDAQYGFLVRSGSSRGSRCWHHHCVQAVQEVVCCVMQLVLAVGC